MRQTTDIIVREHIMAYATLEELRQTIKHLNIIKSVIAN